MGRGEFFPLSCANEQRYHHRSTFPRPRPTAVFPYKDMRRAYAAIIKRKWKGGNRGERWAQKVRNYLGQIENHIILATPCFKHSFFVPREKGGNRGERLFFCSGLEIPNPSRLENGARTGLTPRGKGKEGRRKKKNVFTCAPTNHSRPTLSYPISHI